MNKSKSAESWVNREFEVEVEKVAHGGIFVARYEGRVVFVGHVLPGERALVRVFEDKGKGFCRAEPVKILRASEHRVQHVWPEAEFDLARGVAGAGGAEFGHIWLARQRELKADVIEEALGRMAGLDLRPVVEAVPGDDAANGLGYRTRVQLHISESGQVGPYRERTHQVVPVADLPLANEDIRELELPRRNYQGARKLEVAASSSGQVLIKVDSKISSQDRLIERAGGRTFRITPGGFWQVHHRAADLLASAVVGMAAKVGFDKQADNLDLYGGVGLFAGALAAKFGSDSRVTTVESVRQATQDATLNLSDLPRVKAVCAPTERFLDVAAAEAKGVALAGATVVLDPPRAGAGGHVTSRLIQLAPAHIIYVACDPVALARDLAALLAGGYRVAEFRAFDLFPHTHHVECVVSLVRTG